MSSKYQIQPLFTVSLFTVSANAKVPIFMDEVSSKNEMEQLIKNGVNWRIGMHNEGRRE